MLYYRVIIENRPRQAAMDAATLMGFVMGFVALTWTSLFLVTLR
jgi:hypothetical protein